MGQFRERNILIVDDQPENLQAIADCFAASNLPYMITKAPNGVIAMKLIQKKMPDLVITDWDMPEMNGIELVKNIKSITSEKEIPVIMCTGVMTTPENLQTALKAGAIDYVRKPINDIELISRTRSALMFADSRNKVIAQNKELTELNAMKDKTFTIIAHDLKGPLGSAMNFAETLKNRINHNDIELIRKSLAAMHFTLENSYKLLENLLEWSVFQIGQTKFTPRSLNLNKIVNDNIRLISQPAKEKKIEITNSVHEDTMVRADKNMLNSIIRNLLTNALKFTPNEGHIFINSEKQINDIEISINDTGVGIAPETLELIKKTTNIHSTYGTAHEKGTGLGLLLCKEFIQKHNSELKIESRVGIGSKFSFSLPQ